MKCELCGTEVRVVGNTTKHYEVVARPEISEEELEEFLNEFFRRDDIDDTDLAKALLSKFIIQRRPSEWASGNKHNGTDCDVINCPICFQRRSEK